MTTIEVLLLGLIQGITEFLPVSSSGHLALAQSLMGLQHLDHYILFNLVCHLGTLLAIFCVFSSKIKELILYRHQELKQLLLATLPLFPLVLFLKPIKALYAHPSYLGFFFLTTAFILFLGIHFGKTSSQSKRAVHTWRDALIIGMWQAVAIVPGISRSGSTISGARLLGWNLADAVSFSFLLAIPTILGGTVLEGIHVLRHQESLPSLPLFSYFLGFTLSFIVGIGALKLLVRLAAKHDFSFFAWYCLALGLATTLYFHL